jgi:hypothetical protein
MGRDDGATAGAVFVAFVCGAVAGAAVALLWAPGPGADTRQVLSEKAREGREKGREFLTRQREQINAAVEKGREAYRQARGADEETV